MSAAEDKLLVSLTATELESLVDTRVRAALRDEISQIVEPRFLTVADVAEMLAVCTNTVRTLVKKEGLPTARQLGRELRFERDQVVAWMRARGEAGTPPDRPKTLRRKHLQRVK